MNTQISHPTVGKARKAVGLPTGKRTGRNGKKYPAKITPDPGGKTVDLRAVFLLRAACRFDLYEAGELGLDDAFDPLVPALLSIAGERP
jgi:hypothetical protein